MAVEPVAKTSLPNPATLVTLAAGHSLCWLFVGHSSNDFVLLCSTTQNGVCTCLPRCLCLVFAPRDTRSLLPQRGKEFVERTGFPAEHLLADPDTVTYEALPFKKGVLTTFFNPKVGQGHISECRF